MHYVDVVSAYKSLLKEKEALEISLAALTSSSSASDETSASPSKELTHVLESLATLSSEKSRMEASFKDDKKNMRLELTKKSKEIEEMKEQLKKSTIAQNMEKENFKAKLTSYERRLNDESHLRVSLEIQLNQLKTQFSQTSNSDKLIKELNLELSEARKKLKAYENYQDKFKNDSNVLQMLHTEMEKLKEQHSANIMIEKQRANEANEKSQELTAIHEQRTRLLETRLSELSASVADYHNLRELDQQSIAQLKDKISQLTTFSGETPNFKVKQNSFSSVQEIIDEIGRLKHVLIFENTKLPQQIDLSSVLYGSNADDTTDKAGKENVFKQENDNLRLENSALKRKLSEQAENVATLQKKVQVLNYNIEEYESELKNKAIEITNELKAERNKWLETITSMETEHRSKISQLEQQLQKQRERSLVLLEDKENEIRILKTSHELFVPKKSLSQSEDDGEGSEKNNERSKAGNSNNLGIILSHNPSSNLPETHMIYYSNELARKEIELSTIRKAKQEADNLIRQTLKEKIMLQEELDDRIIQLEQQVER